MEPYNALQQATLRLDGLTLAGFSISGLATYVQVPELDLCFDMGECPLSSLSLNHVLLTHAHGDHSRCMMRHWHLRRMIGIARPATYYLPEEIRAQFEHLVRAEGLFEGVSEADIELPQLVGLVPGQRADLPQRPDLRIGAFPVTHRVPSLGYTIYARKKKLLPEYAQLSGPEIAALRKSGTVVQADVEHPLVTFIGDCIGASLVEQGHIWASNVVIIEATFLEPGEEATAADKMHTHLGEVVAALEALGDRVLAKHIVLKHFSMKYPRDRVPEIVAAAIPERFRDRIRILL
jgi:ribonuclease Z